MSDKHPIIYMDGIHDDTEGVQAAIDGKVVYRPDGSIWNPWVEMLETEPPVKE